MLSHVLVEGKGHVPLVPEKSPHFSEARPEARQAAPSTPPPPPHPQTPAETSLLSQVCCRGEEAFLGEVGAGRVPGRE